MPSQGEYHVAYSASPGGITGVQLPLEAGSGRISCTTDQARAGVSGPLLAPASEAQCPTLTCPPSSFMYQRVTSPPIEWLTMSTLSAPVSWSTCSMKSPS